MKAKVVGTQSVEQLQPELLMKQRAGKKSWQIIAMD